jgi:hypothetical protein
MPSKQKAQKKTKKARKTERKPAVPRASNQRIPRQAKRMSMARMSGSVNANLIISKLGDSLVNPFDVTECIPDGARGVGCFSTKNIISLSTAAGGTGVGLAYIPRLQGQVNAWTSTTSGLATFQSTWDPATQYSSMRSLYTKFRTISAGIRVSYVGPTSLDNGYIVVGLVSGNVPLSTFASLAPSSCSQFFMNYKIIPVRNGCVATWRPVEFDNMSEWAPLGTTPVNQTDTQECPYILLLAGNLTSSNGIFIVEAVSNFEGQYVQQTFQPGGISNQPAVQAVPGWYEKVQDVVSSVATVAPLVGGVINGYVESGVRGAIGAMANGISYPPQLASSGLPRLTNG